MARQRVLCYCRDAKSSSAMDTMLRVVANTLCNNLYMYGNILFYSVKPLFNLRERLWFIYSVLHCKKGFFFFLHQVVLPVSLTSSSITTHVSSKEFVQMVSFLPSPRRMSTPCMYWLLVVSFSNHFLERLLVLYGTKRNGTEPVKRSPIGSWYSNYI